MKKLFTYILILLFLIACDRKGEIVSVDYDKLEEIPVSEIQPQGWLKELLVRQRNGLGLNRNVSGYPYNTCLWEGIIPPGGNPIAQRWWPYEQTAYLLDGLYKCGHLLDDSVLIALGRRNIDYVLAHPREDGRLGPECLGDLQWAFSVFTRLMITDYQVNNNPEVLKGLTDHFLALPDSLTNRQVCIIESMCRTYLYTKDKRILDKAEDIWKKFSVNDHPDNEFFRQKNMIAGDSICVHGVTAAEVGKLPALLYLCTEKEEYREAAVGFMQGIEKYHELADGIPSSSEKLSGKSSEALHETCDISDFIWSYGYLLMATGDISWADKIEKAVFNAGLGAINKDFKAHQYFSSPNQIFATHYSSTAPYGEEGLSRQAYRPGFDVECCTGNVHRIFPNFASRMWMKDPEGGIVAVFYSPSVLKTKAGKENIPIEIEELTDYPFSGKIKFKFRSDRAVEFPFSVRVPYWAKNAKITVNKEQALIVEKNTFYKIERKFNPGDEITLELPMEVRKEYITENAVSITRGPLLFSLLIKEDVKEISDQMKTSREFPAYDIVPASSWNYALQIPDTFVQDNVKVNTKIVTGFPWTPENSPVILELKARRIPGWKADKNTPSLPLSLESISEVTEEVQLVPMGATRIRLSVFPVCN